MAEGPSLRPVPFITVDANGAFQVHDEAAAIIRQIRGPLAVVAVAGLYRTGKSYLLNVLTDTIGQGGFEVGNTINACTKGIWILDPPLQDDEKGVTVLFMDTEGLGSTTRSSTHDSRIFALALLLSSQFIYNSRGVINAQAVEDLSLVANLSQVIQLRSHGEGDAKELHQVFPNFLWVVRDFTLKLEDENGRKISARQYLENCLKPQPAATEAAMATNQIRQMICHYFHERDCVTMVRPADDEETLRRLASMPLASLRPEFQRQIESLRKKVSANIQPKQVLGKTVNGDMFAELASSYVTALNEGGVPVISTALERAVQSQCREAMRGAMTAYEQEIIKRLYRGQELESKLPEPFDAEDVLGVHIQARAKAKTAFWRQVKDRDDAAIAGVGHELKLKLRSRLEELQQANMNSSTETCRAQFSKALDSAVKALSAYPTGAEGETLDFNHLLDQVSTLRITLFGLIMELKAVPGPAAPKVAVDGITAKVLEGAADWGATVAELFKKEEKRLDDTTVELRREFSTVQSRTGAKASMIEQQVKSYERSLTELQARVVDEQGKHQSDSERRNQEIARYTNMLKDLEDLHLKSTETLRKQEAEFRERLERLQTRVAEETARQEMTAEALEQERLQRAQNFEQEKSHAAQALDDLRARVEGLRAAVSEANARAASEEEVLRNRLAAEYAAHAEQLKAEQAALQKQLEEELDSVRRGYDAEFSDLQSTLESKRKILEGMGGSSDTAAKRTSTRLKPKPKGGKCRQS